ncbi:MAG: PAS domain S-box protein [Alphaproteobacteria bacterium]|nr:MAG: PAS domain S-box protein [Alphaproteobacteria bacterium]
MAGSEKTEGSKEPLRFHPIEFPRLEIRSDGIGLFDAVFEQTTAAIFLLDLDFKEHLVKVSDINPAALRLLGLAGGDKAKVMGRNFLSLLHAKTDRKAQERIRRDLIRHQPLRIALELRHRDGGRNRCRANFRPFGGRGTPLRYVAVLREENADLATKLDTLSAELARARTARERMLARLSHDLRTPLNGILGLSELLQAGDLIPLDDEKRTRYARDIHAAGRELLFRIEDMLAAALGEEPDAFILEEGYLALEPLVRRIVRRSDHREEAARIVFAIEAGIPPLFADLRLVDKMIEALLDNAMRASPEDTPIVCRIGRTGEGGVFLEFEDAGPSLTIEDVERAIAAAEEAEDVYTSPVPRLTAGLPMAKTYIEMHGGRMEMKTPDPAPPADRTRSRGKGRSGDGDEDDGRRASPQGLICRLIFPADRVGS